MKKRITIPALVFSLLLTATVSIFFTYAVTERRLTGQYQTQYREEMLRHGDALTLTEVRELLARNYLYSDRINGREALANALKAYVASDGDLYGGYLTADEYAEFVNGQNGVTVGIGVSVTDTGEGARILTVYPDSPAGEAGILPGDLIVAAGDVRYDTDGYEALLTAVRGEEGTEAELTLLRDGKTVTVKVTRRQVTAATVLYSRSADGTTAIIRITSFDNTTEGQFRKAVEQLSSDGCTRIVFDLRGNPGGSLGAVVAVLDAILPEGTIVTTRMADGSSKEYRSDEKEIKLPMAVLVNGNTASAAELFTAALRDYEKAVIIGENTFGKGVMQSYFLLADGSALKMTTGYYDPPCGENYDGVGIRPDVVVTPGESMTGKSIYALDETEDNQLATALAMLGSS